ncbi:MAG: class I SAM-dependent methyltransferase [Treponema sp.]|nr:class I SAM-dependent methyltransferase [Treponema sp.]
MREKTALQARMLNNRLQKRYKHLKKWALRGNIGAFRLYDRDIPEIPLVLDFYQDMISPSESALCGSLYKRPYEKDQNEEELWLLAMKESSAVALGIKPENIFIKLRQKQKDLSQYEKLGNICYEKTIKEGNLLFKVNLSDYLDTGLFPDRRMLRDIIRNESGGKKVLNLFSYTGTFSVYAASGGAVSTDSVDLSNTYLNWARENFSLNGFVSDLMKKIAATNRTNSSEQMNKIEKSAHRLIKADVIEFINIALQEKRRWDIIIIDPPAFSNSKKMSDNFDLNRDLEILLCKCLKLLAPSGKIFASVNLKRKSQSAREMEDSLRGSGVSADVKVTDISARVTDKDFMDKKTPKTFLIERI